MIVLIIACAISVEEDSHITLIIKRLRASSLVFQSRFRFGSTFDRRFVIEAVRFSGLHDAFFV